MAQHSKSKWFDNCGGWSPRHDLKELRAGIASGLLDEQDEFGMTALHLATASGWQDGIEELLRAGADTELRYFRTGETPLYTAVLENNQSIIEVLLSGGANPDAANYWGITPRTSNAVFFTRIKKQKPELPTFRIQNAEHLADHHYPHFKIPDRDEREALQPDQAVDLYVFGPKGKTKHDTVKVRISKRTGRRPKVIYVAAVETPIAETHLPEQTTEVQFGPEHVASVYVPRKSASKRKHM